jgi:hypothetical protein
MARAEVASEDWKALRVLHMSEPRKKVYILNNGDLPPSCPKSKSGQHEWEEQNPRWKTIRGDHHEICRLCAIEQVYDSSD